MKPIQAARLVVLIWMSLAASVQTAGATERYTLGPLLLDPQDADFGPWINRLKDEVSKHWPPPSGLPAGVRGNVVLEFTVAREGAVQRVRVKKSRGEPTLPKAAEGALRASRLAPLPVDYKPKSIKIELGFTANDDPSAPLPQQQR